jgi:hypothetical protein
MRRCVAVLAALGMAFGGARGVARAETGVQPTKWVSAVKPKPLSESIRRGLAWLVEHQQVDGGFSQGEESASMGRGMGEMKDKSNVADTSAAALALIRSGSTPKEGPYAKNITDAVRFVCASVKASDEQSLYVTELRGTRLQAKLGNYIDTFLASMLLAEAKGKMPDQASEDMVGHALQKVMDKIARNQKPDGTFGETGWASALSTSMAAKGVNRAALAQPGAVSEGVREKLEKQARDQFDGKTGRFSGKESAGVDLYSTAASLGAMQDSANTNSAQRHALEERSTKARTPAEREEIQRLLKRHDDVGRDLDAARKAAVQKLDDDRFIAGFGSNGGEEFLSYMNLGESLVVKGGPDWEKWDKKIAENLNHIQNNDGSWTGHHCITGRTFCTSAALLVLLTDRAPVPVTTAFSRR